MKKVMTGSILAILSLLVLTLAVPALAQNGGTPPGGVSQSPPSGIYLDQPTLIRVAQTLGLTADELVSRLQQGTTLNDIAVERGVSVEKVIEAIISPYQAQLQLQVSYGYLTQEQADTLLKQAREHARVLLTQDLSRQGGKGNDTWNDMVNDCNRFMGAWNGSQNGPVGMMGGGWGGMMGSGWGGMMGYGWGGATDNDGGGTTGSRWSAPLNNPVSSFFSGFSRTLSGWGNSFTRGFGGMMGSGGGMMGW